jgi:hypothetical protein
MTPAFRAALLALGALLLLTAGVWIWRSGEKPTEDLTRPEGRPAEPRAENPELVAEGSPSLASRPPDPTSVRPGGAGSAPPPRVPSGVDLSDPAQARAYLADLLGRRPIPWGDVALVLKVMTEPLEAGVRALLIDTLRVGDRNGALTALRVARDPALIPDLFALVDDAAAPTGARRVALQVLGAMPAGERDAVVRELEARLKGARSADGDVLYAIADRGGGEAMRAVTEYALRSGADGALAQTLVGRFDLKNDTAAQTVLAEALGRKAQPATLEALVRLAASPGAAGLAAPLIALDRDDQSMALREQVFTALAQIGSGDAVAHLIAVARQPGQFGESATLALANLPGAAPEARDALVQELERAGAGPRPELARGSLLEALGRMRVEAALAPAVAALRDGNERVRNSALVSLQGQGERARGHVAEVSSLFLTGSLATRVRVVNALTAMGGAEAQKELEGFAQRTDLTPSLKQTLDVALADLQRRNLPPGAPGATPTDAD